MENKKEDKIKANIAMAVETFSSIMCSKCPKSETIAGDEYDAGEQFFKKGWHATEQNVYCPSCNKKRKRNT